MQFSMTDEVINLIENTANMLQEIIHERAEKLANKNAEERIKEMRREMTEEIKQCFYPRTHPSMIRYAITEMILKYLFELYKIPIEKINMQVMRGHTCEYYYKDRLLLRTE